MATVEKVIANAMYNMILGQLKIGERQAIGEGLGLNDAVAYQK